MRRALNEALLAYYSLCCWLCPYLVFFAIYSWLPVMDLSVWEIKIRGPNNWPFLLIAGSDRENKPKSCRGRRYSCRHSSCSRFKQSYWVQNGSFLCRFSWYAILILTIKNPISMYPLNSWDFPYITYFSLLDYLRVQVRNSYSLSSRYCTYQNSQ